MDSITCGEWIGMPIHHLPRTSFCFSDAVLSIVFLDLFRSPLNRSEFPLCTPSPSSLPRLLSLCQLVLCDLTAEEAIRLYIRFGMFTFMAPAVALSLTWLLETPLYI